MGRTWPTLYFFGCAPRPSHGEPSLTATHSRLSGERAASAWRKRERRQRTRIRAARANAESMFRLFYSYISATKKHKMELKFLRFLCFFVATYSAIDCVHHTPDFNIHANPF